jgi:hypothetical protein
MGMGQNSLKTLPLWAYQGNMTGASMVIPTANTEDDT